MLVECCKFGKVIRLVSPEGPLFDPLGCIAVTFENMSSARECSSSLHGRWFDSRQIETMVFSPPTIAPYTAFSSSSLQNHVEVKVEVKTEVKAEDRNRVSPTTNGGSTGNQHVPSTVINQVEGSSTVDPVKHATPGETLEIDLPDVDDFLNSFL